MNNVPHNLWSLYSDVLSKARFIDLTHAFGPGQPCFPGFPDEERKILFDFANGDTARVHHYSFVGQWGTHVDPPIHFDRNGQALDEIPVSQMLLPLVVIDISERVRNDPDSLPRIADVEAWEQRNGTIPKGCFVALRTGWHTRWPDHALFRNADAQGVSHAPGWSMEVLKLLIEGRQVRAIGHEQIDTDPGLHTSRGEEAMESYVLHQGCWQIELLKNLEHVPEAGALIMASWPKPRGGSGFPARAVAIVPG